MWTSQVELLVWCSESRAGARLRACVLLWWWRRRSWLGLPSSFPEKNNNHTTAHPERPPNHQRLKSDQVNICVPRLRYLFKWCFHLIFQTLKVEGCDRNMDSLEIPTSHNTLLKLYEWWIRLANCEPRCCHRSALDCDTLWRMVNSERRACSKQPSSYVWEVAFKTQDEKETMAPETKKRQGVTRRVLTFPIAREQTWRKNPPSTELSNVPPLSGGLKACLRSAWMFTISISLLSRASPKNAKIIKWWMNGMNKKHVCFFKSLLQIYIYISNWTKHLYI